MKIFNAVEVRDTNAHNSIVYLNKFDDLTHARTISVKRTVVYKNGLNQVCSLQVQGSVDEAFTDPVAIGTAINAAASMSAPLYETVSDHFPYLRIVGTCAVAPASGSLNAWILP